MFRNPLHKNSSQSELLKAKAESLSSIVVKLDELSEESLAGGAIALPAFLNQANKAK